MSMTPPLLGPEKFSEPRFVHNGKPYYAFRFEDEANGIRDFYSEEGEGLKRMFLKAPLEFARITSRYSKKPFPSGSEALEGPLRYGLCGTNRYAHPRNGGWYSCRGHVYECERELCKNQTQRNLYHTVSAYEPHRKRYAKWHTRRARASNRLMWAQPVWRPGLMSATASGKMGSKWIHCVSPCNGRNPCHPNCGQVTRPTWRRSKHRLIPWLRLPSRI